MRPPVQEPPVPDQEQERREQAIKRIRDKNVFKVHLAAYLLINFGLFVAWASTGIGYFWPIFALVGWGAGIAVHAYCIYRGNDRNAFMLHLVAYLVINAWFVVMWALTETGFFFWPIFSILLWGAGVAIHGYSVYGGSSQITETQIKREMKRLP
jgi:uncharacterized protein with PQ loop repeat